MVYLNRDGFTLVEMLFAFAIFLTIVFFISPIFQMMLNHNGINARLQIMEWDVFCSQMKKEIRMSTNAQVIDNRLVLTVDSGTVVYEKYGDSLRRRVNYTGHEIILQSVKEVTFRLLNNALNVSVKDLSGKEYEATVYSFVDWNDSP